MFPLLHEVFFLGHLSAAAMPHDAVPGPTRHHYRISQLTQIKAQPMSEPLSRTIASLLVPDDPIGRSCPSKDLYDGYWWDGPLAAVTAKCNALVPGDCGSPADWVLGSAASCCIDRWEIPAKVRYMYLTVSQPQRVKRAFQYGALRERLVPTRRLIDGECSG